MLKIFKRTYFSNPRRALMYVPASDERKLAKIPRLGADCVCVDCEDGVAITAKDDARKNVAKIVSGQKVIDFGKSEFSVRVNSVSSGLCEEDVKVAFQDVKFAPSAVHLPKVDDVDQLETFFGLFKPKTRTALIMFIESARALLAINDIFAAARRLETPTLIPETVVFGSDDFVADIGATRTESASELMYARQKVVTAAKAFELQAIDLVHIDYKDKVGLERQSLEGARMGFTGKQVIHPGQVDVVQKAFAPSEEKMKWAEDLVTEFRQREESGKGAFNFRGSMIDMPLVKQAENIIRMKEFLK